MARDNDRSGSSGADPAPTPEAVTCAESEAQCLTGFLKRSALAAGILIASLIMAAIVISATR